ncbi:MAG: energy transducer TonB [Candidatus Kapaibacterium sp.]|nr:MAG: energy transducer TonB [Candidatus Kapabacteria bacterium]
MSVPPPKPVSISFVVAQAFLPVRFANVLKSPKSNIMALHSFHKRIVQPTRRGFTVLAGVCMVWLLGYVGFATMYSSQPKQNVRVNRMKLLQPTAAIVSESSTKAALPQSPIKPRVRVGTFVPVPDILVTYGFSCNFENIDNIGSTNATNADISDTGYLEWANAEDTESSDDNDPYADFPVEKEPFIDLKEVQKKVVYPALAKRAKIEGRVNIRVIVGKNGIPRKPIIESTDSDLLNNEAVRVVMNSVFTPALQNNQPIDCWISIPIVFRLR